MDTSKKAHVEATLTVFGETVTVREVISALSSVPDTAEVEHVMRDVEGNVEITVSFAPTPFKPALTYPPGVRGVSGQTTTPRGE